tara:strand:- start:693 stop:833 length:141 start_codon:yes stop_codon:yes gene_type:complete
MSVTRTWTKKDSKGREETWEWEVTPEHLSALAAYYELVAKNYETLS